MLSTEMEYLCTELECYVQCWHAFDRVGIPLYRVGNLRTELDCFVHSWNTFVQSWNTFVRSWNTFVLSWNAFDRVGIHLYRVEMLSRGF
jgi:hypothetical protein